MTTTRIHHAWHCGHSRPPFHETPHGKCRTQANEFKEPTHRLVHRSLSKKKATSCLVAKQGLAIEHGADSLERSSRPLHTPKCGYASDVSPASSCIICTINEFTLSMPSVQRFAFPLLLPGRHDIQGSRPESRRYKSRSFPTGGTCLTQGVAVELINGQLIPLSPAPVFPNPAQLYRPTGLFSVAFIYCRSTHSSVSIVSHRYCGVATFGLFGFRIVPTSGAQGLRGSGVQGQRKTVTYSGPKAPAQSGRRG